MYSLGIPLGCVITKTTPLRASPLISTYDDGLVGVIHQPPVGQSLKSASGILLRNS